MGNSVRDAEDIKFLDNLSDIEKFKFYFSKTLSLCYKFSKFITDRADNRRKNFKSTIFLNSKIQDLYLYPLIRYTNNVSEISSSIESGSSYFNLCSPILILNQELSNLFIERNGDNNEIFANKVDLVLKTIVDFFVAVVDYEKSKNSTDNSVVALYAKISYDINLILNNKDFKFNSNNSSSVISSPVFNKFTNSLEIFFNEVTKVNYDGLYGFFSNIRDNSNNAYLSNDVENDKRVYSNLVSSYNSLIELVKKNKFGFVESNLIDGFKIDLKLFGSLLLALMNSKNESLFQENFYIFVKGKAQFSGLIKFYGLYVRDKDMKSQIEVLENQANMFS
ncbi:MAG: hypothetical protein PF569_01275 [Candidatus Woesearchaeota archaeon]|jgi:hypothetical protein|nr:hypothetical protein [Candidatus Woesearchaeota archaeon]